MKNIKVTATVPSTISKLGRNYKLTPYVMALERICSPIFHIPHFENTLKKKTLLKRSIKEKGSQTSQDCSIVY